jgi:UDP:flavonoid glycosyltransferase YjiC (YdhE family)
MQMGKRIVITTFGSYGDVYPYIGLALGLSARGHTPVLAMPAYYRATVEREGLDFHPVRPDVDPTDRAMVARIMDASRGTEFLVRHLLLGSLRESYADLRDAARGADLLLTHPVTFAGPILAQRERLPWASSVLAPMSFFSVHDLPVFPPAPWLKRLERIPGVAAALVGMARRVIGGWGEAVYALRKELGLPKGGDPIFEGQHSPRMVLALFSRVLADPRPDWPASVRITGAIPYNGPDSQRPLSPELEAFLAAGPPPVAFTLGSSAVGAAGDFYQESVEAVRRLGVRAVLLVGPHAENRALGALPEGVHLEDFAPHAALFPRASVVVHQGGAGTLHQALRAGRPTLVVPFAHDQPDNAHRVERLGVSRTLRPARYRAERVAKELKMLLEEPAYAARAGAVAERVRGEDGVGAACDAIEEVLAARV